MEIMYFLDSFVDLFQRHKALTMVSTLAWTYWSEQRHGFQRLGMNDSFRGFSDNGIKCHKGYAFHTHIGLGTKARY